MVSFAKERPFAWRIVDKERWLIGVSRQQQPSQGGLFRSARASHWLPEIDRKVSAHGFNKKPSNKGWQLFYRDSVMRVPFWSKTTPDHPTDCVDDSRAFFGCTVTPNTGERGWKRVPIIPRTSSHEEKSPLPWLDGKSCVFPGKASDHETSKSSIFGDAEKAKASLGRLEIRSPHPYNAYRGWEEWPIPKFYNENGLLVWNGLTKTQMTQCQGLDLLSGLFCTRNVG